MTTKTTHIVAHEAAYTSLDVVVDPVYPNHIGFLIMDDVGELTGAFDLPRDGARELARFILDETA